MARTPVEIGRSFHKAGSAWVIWTLDSFNEKTKPVHARLVRVDDPTTSIIVSIDVLSRRLKDYGISHGSIRLSDGTTPKGYYLANFAEAFERFLGTSRRCNQTYLVFRSKRMIPIERV